MKRISLYIGLVSVLLVLAGGLGYVLYPQFLGFYVIPWVLALIGLVVYLIYNLAEVRSFFISRSAKYGAGSVISIILVTGIIIFISLISVQHSARLDLTENKRFSLSPQTIKVLKGLSEPVKASAFLQEGGPDKAMVTDLLDQYAHVSPQFTYEIIDPDREPGRAQKAGITRYGTVVVESGGRNKQVMNADEEQLTNALIGLINPEKKVVYFLGGHGEKDIDNFNKEGVGTVKDTLMDQNYEVNKLILMQARQVPDDAAVLVAAGPQKDPFPSELEAIEDYLRKGGKVILMIDPQTCPELASFLTRFKVELGNDIVIDKMSRLFGADYTMPVISRYTAHPITRDFTFASFFPVARSVSVAKEEIEGVTAVPLAQTEGQAWGETGLEELSREGMAKYDEGRDLAGPVPVAVVGSVKVAPGEGQDPKKEGKFIVFGDSDFIANAYVDLQGNGDLFYSALNWLAGEEDLVSIRPKDVKSDPLILTSLQSRLIFWLPVVVLPLAVLIIGVGIVWRTRGR